MHQPFKSFGPSSSRSRRSPLVALIVAVCVACAGAGSRPESASDLSDADAARYRLQLRHNPVDPGQAFRCYGQCQSQEAPQGYLKCLMECPGFDITPGVRCAADEVPPIAACFTVRQVPRQSEPSPGWVVLAVIANVALIVTLASVCASSPSQCGYGYAPYPYTPPVPPF